MLGWVIGLPRPFLDLFQTPEGHKSSSVTVTIPCTYDYITIPTLKKSAPDHPYLRNYLSLKIELHDDTIWKSIPEL